MSSTLSLTWAVSLSRELPSISFSTTRRRRRPSKRPSGMTPCSESLHTSRSLAGRRCPTSPYLSSRRFLTLGARRREEGRGPARGGRGRALAVMFRRHGQIEKAITLLLAPTHAPYLYTDDHLLTAFVAIEAYHDIRIGGTAVDPRQHEERVDAIVAAASVEHRASANEMPPESAPACLPAGDGRRRRSEYERPATLGVGRRGPTVTISGCLTASHSPELEADRGFWWVAAHTSPGIVPSDTGRWDSSPAVAAPVAAGLPLHWGYGPLHVEHPTVTGADVSPPCGHSPAPGSGRHAVTGKQSGPPCRTSSTDISWTEMFSGFTYLAVGTRSPGAGGAAD